MKKKMAILAIFTIFSFFGMGFDSFFGQMRDDKPVPTGEMLEYHVNVNNHGEDDIDDVHLRMVIYELGELIVVNTFDVEDSESDGKFLVWNTEGVPPGDYWARVTLSNDDFHEVKHRIVTIV